MDAKEAVALAKRHVEDLFQSENIQNLGLEEIEFDRPSRVWEVTLGFSRPWDVYSSGGLPIERHPPRTYKKISINDNNMTVVSVKNRDVAET